MAYLFDIFNADRKLCREICRLPLLWMHPCERQVEKIHKILIHTIGLFIVWSGLWTQFSVSYKELSVLILLINFLDRIIDPYTHSLNSFRLISNFAQDYHN